MRACADLKNVSFPRFFGDFLNFKKTCMGGVNNFAIEIFTGRVITNIIFCSHDVSSVTIFPVVPELATPDDSESFDSDGVWGILLYIWSYESLLV